MRTLRLARRVGASTSARVSVGSNPSGTMATMSPMAKMKSSQGGTPRTQPIAKNTSPIRIARIAIHRLRWAISRRKGETPTRLVWARCAILPNSVCMPVAKTTALASPETIEVPVSRMFLLWINSSASEGSASRALGRDSPVIVAVLTRTPNASISRQSAGMLSPCSRSTTSPGTSWVTASDVALPSRIAFTSCGSSLSSVASVCSARYSCQKENRPLTTITPMTTPPTFAMPWPGALHSPTNASAAASHRITAKKWKNSLRKRSQSGWPATFSTWLGPNSRNRFSASATDNPCGALRRLAMDSATESRSILTFGKGMERDAGPRTSRALPAIQSWYSAAGSPSPRIGSAGAATPEICPRCADPHHAPVFPRRRHGAANARYLPRTRPVPLPPIPTQRRVIKTPTMAPNAAAIPMARQGFSRT